MALMIRDSISEQVKFTFRAEPGEFYLRLVIREDGRRQVIRPVNTESSIEEINADAANVPPIITVLYMLHELGDVTSLLYLNYRRY